MLAITPIEKVEDIAQTNQIVTGNSIPELTSQAFSISNLPLQNKNINQNFQSSTASLIPTTVQHKLIQARKIQAHRAVVEEKKIEAQQSVHAQEQSVTNPDHIERQRQATQDQVTQKLREQKIDIEKQVDAQRVAVERSLGLDKAPPTVPRIPLDWIKRVFSSGAR
ncbi:f6e24b85-333a-463e-be5f-fd92a7e95b21 [Sclerotinia trifoliorum]|uniref:F6e24b85-333a-463e-be5f-fd92a7e95b21 n=1 Tax=Sclerotinia trifoliorum TaxID=28548 RepID=A0A8H2VPS5_9HELO|nr:f6e24b85-333a-463e-be5f-fd92a7e95b21 [Sclerotinia trifoliorum]